MKPDSVGVHIAQVLTTNAAAWSVAMTEINTLLTTISVVLATAYTIYRFIKDRSKKTD